MDSHFRKDIRVIKRKYTPQLIFGGAIYESSYLYGSRSPLLTGLAVLLSVLLVSGLFSPLRAAAAGPLIEYVVNGGFETGDFSGWSVDGINMLPEVQGEEVHSGDHAALMGDQRMHPNYTVEAIIEQEVAIPSGAEGPLVLEFDYLVDGSDSEFDYLVVLINGEEIFFIDADSGGWQTYQYDLDDLEEGVGDTFTLTIITGTLDGLYPVNYYVDNFTLEVDGVELIENGGFETGDFSGWDVIESGLFPAVQGSQVSGGNYAAHMGDGGGGMYPSPGIAAIAQEITLPAWAEDPLLQLAFLVEFAEGTEDIEFDGDEYSWLEVLIDDQQVLYACSHSHGWQDHEYDLSEYRGKTFTLTVRAALDFEAMYDWINENEMDSFPINFYVDDISITASEDEPEEKPDDPGPPQKPSKKELPRTGGTLPLGELLALGLIPGGAVLLGLRRKLSR